MISLVLYEGASYRPADLVRLLGEADPYLDSASVRALAEETQRLLITLPLSSAVPDARFTSEDSEAEIDIGDSEDHLGSLARPHARHDGIQLRHLVGSGVLQSTSADIQLEILPKVTQMDDTAASRAGLLRMWSYAADLSLRDNAVPALMQAARLPLHEWLMQRFLEQVDRLLARGIRAHYVEEEGNLATVRGRLAVGENLRQNAFAPQRFYCRYETFSPNRPENRLIRRAIAKIQARTQVPATRKRASTLTEWLHEIPPSVDIARDFSLWRVDRLMTHYQEIRPTCEWILREQSPAPTAGRQALFGRFVRMNDVFERYVTRWMQERMPADHAVAGPGEGRDATRVLCASRLGLVGHRMQPDIRVHHVQGRSRRCTAVLDAKWKKSRDDGKIASREDFYQMYAYASHWLRTQASEAGGPSPDSLIGLVYPSVNPRDTSVPFKFSDLGHVQGAAMKFLLPQIMEEGGHREWNEGFLLNGLDAFPAWLGACRT